MWSTTKPLLYGLLWLHIGEKLWWDSKEHGRGNLFGNGVSEVVMVLKHTCQVPCITKNRLFTRVLRSRIGPRHWGSSHGGWWFVLEYYKYSYTYIYMLIIGWLPHLDSHVTIDALVMGNKYTVFMCEWAIGWTCQTPGLSAMHDYLLFIKHMNYCMCMWDLHVEIKEWGVKGRRD